MPNIAHLTEQELRRLLSEKLKLADLKTIWIEVFDSNYDDDHPGLSLKLGCIELVDRARKIVGCWPKLLKAIRDCRPDLDDAPEPPQTVATVVAAPPKPVRRVLVLAANPLDTDKLNLERETDEIRKQLALAKGGTTFEAICETEVKPTDLARLLLTHQPEIIHYCGHGQPSGKLVLENSAQLTQTVAPQAFAGLLASLPVNQRPKCVILNACYSWDAAKLLSTHVGFVGGMTREVGDSAAIEFSTGFYEALALGQTFKTAFDLASNRLELLSLPDAVLPHCTDPTLETKTTTRTPTPKNDDEDAARRYRVWYATNRQFNHPDQPNRGFSNQRDNQLHWGHCDVDIPKGHKVGSIGTPFYQRWTKILQSDWISVRQIQSLANQAAWTQNLQDHLKTLDFGGEKIVLAFIHGYNVTFENAAIRAAQIGFDLQLPGAMSFFSWPSKGGIFGYGADEASIEASEPHIVEFLTALADQPGADRVHVIAHSMGNRGLLRSVQRVVTQAQSRSKKPFGHVVLAAPDVDVDVFRDLSRYMHLVADQTTMYVSSKDRALAASGIVHAEPRAGYTPPVTIVDQIDTIETSKVDLTFLGHGYYAAARSVIADMHNLLVHNLPVAKRLLEKQSNNGQVFWRFPA